MLEYIEFIERRDGNCFYRIVDDLFDIVVHIKCPKICGLFIHENILRPIILIREYKDRRLPIAKNIARYYKYYYGRWECKQYLVKQKSLIDTHLPAWEYGSKYYPCVLKHLEEMLLPEI